MALRFPPDATLADVGEFGLIAALAGPLRAGRAGAGRSRRRRGRAAGPKTGHVVVSTDLMVEGRHFRRDWASAADIGHRAAAQNLSDINAMGGRATSLTIGLAAPADLPVAVGARLRPRLRRGVRAGRRQRRRRRPDPGRPGRDRGDRARRLHRGPGAALRARTPATSLAPHRPAGLGRRRPRGARPRVPVAAGAGGGLPPPGAAVRRRPGRRRGRRHLDDRHLRRAARRRRPHRRPPPASPSTSAAAPSRSPSRCSAVGAALGADPIEFILGGGDDHALLATFPEGVGPEGWPVVGSVGRGPGVTVDGAEYDGPTGWTHF